MEHGTNRKCRIDVLCFILLLLFLVPVLTFSENARAGPVQPFSRWGTAKLDGLSVPNGCTIGAWIDGTCYMKNHTYHGDGSFSIDCPGHDTDEKSCKMGGLEGDMMIYTLAKENRTYIARETDIFSSVTGISERPDLTFYSEGQPTGLLINEVVPWPGNDGPDYIFIYNPSHLIEDLFHWRLEDSRGWSQELTGSIPPGECLYIDLGGNDLDPGGGELKLAWYSNDPLMAGGDAWIVMDRVEWGNQSVGGRNTTMPDFPKEMGPGESMKREPNGTDTNDCLQDFTHWPICTPRPRGIVRGRVVNDENLPVGDVLVGIHTENGTMDTNMTGDDGRFQFVVPGGVYAIMAEKDNYSKYILENIEIEPGSDMFLKVVLLEETGMENGTLSGIVSSPGGPLVYADVTAVNTSSGLAHSIRSDDNGYFTLSLSGGIYNVTASSPGFHDNSFNGIKIDPGENVILDIFLPKMEENGGGENRTGTGILMGRVMDDSGVPLPESVIEIRNLTSGGTHTARCDDSGNYRVELPLGLYMAYAKKKGFSTDISLVTIEEGKSTLANFLLTPSTKNANLDCTVVDDMGEPIRYAKILVMMDDAAILEAWTDSLGHSLFKEIPAGNIEIVVSKEGFETWHSQEMEMEEGVSEVILIKMEREDGPYAGDEEIEKGERSIWVLLLSCLFVLSIFIGVFALQRRRHSKQTGDREEFKDSKDNLK